MEKRDLIKVFGIPEAGYDVIDLILSPKEQQFLLLSDPDQTYSREQLCDLIMRSDLDKEGTLSGIREGREMAEAFIDEMFHRGVLNRDDDGISYRTGSFYGRLDIFATEEIDTYDHLSRETKERLDAWYFNAYLDFLGTLENAHPTQDEVLPLEDVLTFIEQRDDTPYLALCDCRRLIQNCSQPTETCITYRTAPNSFVKRGLVKAITKEEAKEVVREADRQGLIHTVNPGGICSCCTDCCYLFRAARARDSQGIWPRVHYVVKIDKGKCINCGVCRKRCKFAVFTKENEVRISQKSNCQGCGLCVTACPTGALMLTEKSGE